jgi:hypothetical protein
MFDAGVGLFQFRESWDDAIDSLADAGLRINADPDGRYEGLL